MGMVQDLRVSNDGVAMEPGLSQRNYPQSCVSINPDSQEEILHGLRDFRCRGLFNGFLMFRAWLTSN